jgi:hypothetical protein
MLLKPRTIRMSFPVLLPPQRGMSISSFSSDDMEFLDFEANHAQDGGGPTGQRSGSPFSMVEDAGLASPISNTSSQNVGSERFIFHLDLCSVVEIV